MIQDFSEIFSQTYTNPVYPRSFPDPFVLKFRGEYYAYSTGFWRDGRVFGVLRSRDLVNWQEIGGAMQRLESDAPFYWAPEVTYANGKFYLYYSVGNETLMEIRVAVSDSPDGGFVDSGHVLTTEEFAIDAHVFEDTDGVRYMFYATDFLTHTHIGTGTVVDRMLDFFTLEGKPRPVTRAKYDWQVYDPQRKEKGGVRWHTIEGSFVLKRKGIYYQMFSGGNWQNITYGVSFAVTDDIRRDEEWAQFSDGEKVLPILRTIPNLVVGPGHNSVVRGANNRELFCVYHRWTEHGRVLSIDRMDFAGAARILIKGATSTPQPAPFAPQIADFFDEFSESNWESVSGEWRVESNCMISGAAEKNELLCRHQAESFLCEVSLQSLDGSGGRFGVLLRNDGGEIFRFLLVPGEKRAVAVWFESGEEKTQSFSLYEDFDFRAFHLLRVEADHRRLQITLDGNTVRFEKTLLEAASRIALASENSPAAFSGFALTGGFEDTFEYENPSEKGWREISGAQKACRIENSNLKIESAGDFAAAVAKNFSAQDFELAANFRVTEIKTKHFRFGIHFYFDGAAQFSVYFRAGEMNWVLETDGQVFELPGGYLPDVFHQLCFIKTGSRIVMQFETKTLGLIEFEKRADEIVFSVENGAAEFDMIRLTAL